MLSCAVTPAATAFPSFLTSPPDSWISSWHCCTMGRAAVWNSSYTHDEQPCVCLIEEGSAFWAFFKLRFILSYCVLFRQLAGAAEPCRPLEFLGHERGVLFLQAMGTCSPASVGTKGGHVLCRSLPDQHVS